MTLLLQSDMCLGLLAETGTDIHTVDIVYTSAVTLCFLIKHLWSCYPLHLKVPPQFIVHAVQA